VQDDDLYEVIPPALAADPRDHPPTFKLRTDLRPAARRFCTRPRRPVGCSCADPAGPKSARKARRSSLSKSATMMLAGLTSRCKARDQNVRADRHHQRPHRGYKRRLKQVKRVGCGFRNRDNSARRIRFHCTRKQRAATRLHADCPVKVEEPLNLGSISTTRA